MSSVINLKCSNSEFIRSKSNCYVRTAGFQGRPSAALRLSYTGDRAKNFLRVERGVSPK